MAAIADVIMLVSYFPYLTYAVPAVAGMFMMIPLIEIGPAYSFGCYAVSSVLALIMGEPESSVLYVCLFGFYPIIKALIERINNTFVQWAVKFAVFNICVLAFYFIASFIFSVSFDDLGNFGRYGAYAFLLFCNAAFVLYDIALSRVAGLYYRRFHPRISKIFKA